MGNDDLRDYTRGVGPAALGGRLRRLVERIDGDVAKIYASYGVRFEQRWFGLINQLDCNGPMSVSELASALGITHVSVSQSRKSLENAGIVNSAPDPNDGRRRTVQLTASGKEFVETMRPIWQAFEAATIKLNREAENVLTSLDRLEDALNKESMFERITAQLSD